MDYTKIIDDLTGQEFIHRKNKDNSISVIPCDPANSDYQRYLRWLENPDADESGTL